MSNSKNTENSATTKDSSSETSLVRKVLSISIPISIVLIATVILVTFYIQDPEKFKRIFTCKCKKDANSAKTADMKAANSTRQLNAANKPSQLNS